MALFKKKTKESEYQKAQTEMNQETVSKASERIYFDEITGDDQKTLFLIEKLINHQPLVLNFERVDIPTANKVLAFIAGAVYALRGKTVKLDEKIYLFALSEEFLDGSLDDWIRFING